MLGLFQGMPGARAYRRLLTEEGISPDAGPDLIDRALACLHGGAPRGHMEAAA
jgi:tRNA-dihydrouridine synthase A